MLLGKASHTTISDYSEEIQEEMGIEVYHFMEWLELVLALTEQLFILPGEASDLKAIELILKTFQNTDAEQNGEIANFIRELSEKQSGIQLSTGAQQAIKLLLQYIEAGPKKPGALDCSYRVTEESRAITNIFTGGASTNVY